MAVARNIGSYFALRKPIIAINSNPSTIQTQKSGGAGTFRRLRREPGKDQTKGQEHPTDNSQPSLSGYCCMLLRISLLFRQEEIRSLERVEAFA
jgi:hypothetical protein